MRPLDLVLYTTLVAMAGLQLRIFRRVSKQLRICSDEEVKSPVKAPLVRANLPANTVLIGQRREHGKGIG